MPSKSFKSFITEGISVFDHDNSAVPFSEDNFEDAIHNKLTAKKRITVQNYNHVTVYDIGMLTPNPDEYYRALSGFKGSEKFSASAGTNIITALKSQSTGGSSRLRVYSEERIYNTAIDNLLEYIDANNRVIGKLYLGNIPSRYSVGKKLQEVFISKYSGELQHIQLHKPTYLDLIQALLDGSINSSITFNDMVHQFNTKYGVHISHRVSYRLIDDIWDSLESYRKYILHDYIPASERNLKIIAGSINKLLDYVNRGNSLDLPASTKDLFGPAGSRTKLRVSLHDEDKQIFGNNTEDFTILIFDDDKSRGLTTRNLTHDIVNWHKSVGAKNHINILYAYLVMAPPPNA